MRIGIDARFLTHPQSGGFKTYTTNLISGLADVDSVNEYLLYVDRTPKDDFVIPDRPNFTTRIVPGAAPLVGMPWREQVGLARQASRDSLDLLHCPNLTAPLRLACPKVVTIHDMIWLFPEQFASGAPTGKRSLMQWYYRQIPQSSACGAARIITVSHASKASIMEHLGIPDERICVTHEAANPLFRPITDRSRIDAVREKYDLPERFVLAIGSADPRKNLATLLDAYHLLPPELQTRFPLVIVWTHSLLAAGLAGQAEALDLADRVRFLQRVSDYDLLLLYNAASLFVFPSLFEGFGLPPLEAMACGTPVVAADNSSIPEITGDAAVLVDSRDPAAMAAAMAGVLNDPIRAAELRAKGLQQAARFSWTKCARETVRVYEAAGSRSRRSSDGG